MRSSQVDLFSKTKHKICENCVNTKKYFQTQLPIKMIDLDDYLAADDKNQTTNLITGLKQNNFIDYSFEKIPVGKIAMYLIVTNYKKSSLYLTERESFDYKICLENVLLTIIGMKKFLNDFMPDIGIFYNSLYPVNHAVKQLFDQLHVPSFVMHGNMSFPRLDSDIFLSKDDPFAYIAYTKDIWKKFSEIPGSASQYSEVTDHLLYLFKSTSGRVYSVKASGSTKEIYTKYDFNPGQKVFLATMSSLDELWAAQLVGVVTNRQPVFATPALWIEELLHYFLAHLRHREISIVFGLIYFFTHGGKKSLLIYKSILQLQKLRKVLCNPFIHPQVLRHFRIAEIKLGYFTAVQI